MINSMLTCLDAAVKVLEDAKKPLYYKEITRRAISRGMISPKGKTPDATMNSAIIVNIKNNGAKSMFVKTKPATYGLNPNWLKNGSKNKPVAESGRQSGVLKSKNKRYISTGGKYLVTGKMILHGFNANLLVVNEGLDIVAIKDGNMYGVQVKAANKSATGYVADISTAAYERTNKGNTFYVFVLLGKPETYVILPFHIMQSLIDDKHIKTLPKSSRYRAVFSRGGDKVYLGKKDVTSYVDSWNSIT